MLASTRPQAIAYLLVPRADASGECGGPGGHIAPEPVFPAKYESAEHADGFAVEFTSTRLERPNRSQVSRLPMHHSRGRERMGSQWKRTIITLSSSYRKAA